MEHVSFITYQHPLTAKLFGLGYALGEVVRVDGRAVRVTGRRFVGLDEDGVAMHEVSAESLGGVEDERAARALSFDQHFLGLPPVPLTMLPEGRPVASKTGGDGSVRAV